MLEVPCWEISEDYLGVALIQPGDSVIIKMKWLNAIFMRNKKGGTARTTRPFLSAVIESGHFFLQKMPVKCTLAYEDVAAKRRRSVQQSVLRMKKFELLVIMNEVHFDFNKSFYIKLNF